MKTIRINENVQLGVHDRCEMYNVVIDNSTRKVKKYHCRFTTMDKKGIQKLVDKLIEKRMITIFGESTTNVHINIWDIDETKELYIETYHYNSDLPPDELFDDYDGTMVYEEFLNS